jgi:hypothetical protein
MRCGIGLRSGFFVASRACTDTPVKPSVLGTKNTSTVPLLGPFGHCTGWRCARRHRHRCSARRLAIVGWIEGTYHRRRRQRGLGRLTPIEFETIMTTTTANAA